MNSQRADKYWRETFGLSSAVMDWILGQGSVVLYQTLLANQLAVRIAESLGCREYARMLYLGLE